MTPLFKYISPLIGTKGVYEFSHDFNVTEGELLECIAVRTLSDYIANNEDPWNDFYKPAGLTEANYQEDLAINIEIASLRNDGGYVYRIPCRYIASYPIQDGIGYHAVTLPCALPAIRIDQDLTTLIDEMKKTILSNLGVSSVISVVQTSTVRAIDGAADQRIQAERQLIVDQNASVYAELAQKDQKIAELQQRISVLEAYIIANAP